MNRFSIAKPKSFEEAAAIATDDRFSLPVLKAGGMDVLDLMKEGILEPDLLIDVRELRPMGGRKNIWQMNAEDGTLRLVIGAGATLATIAQSSGINELAPTVAQTCASAATPQIRNVATAAGNLLQRPRCWYFRSQQFDCLKKGGDTCYAVHGENQHHAILGGGPCHIVHPSNLAISLMVCDGVVHLTGGDRAQLPIADLFHRPMHGVLNEHNLQRGEVITHITLKPRPQSAFYAVKHKQSFDWPIVAAAAALEMDGDVIRSASICAGAVAPVPWPLPGVAAALAGVNMEDDAAVRTACNRATAGANALSENGHKIKLLPVAVHRAVRMAAGRNVEGE